METDNQRASIRYDPERNSLIVIRPSEADRDSQLIGLVRDISEGGCAAVFQREFFDFPQGCTFEVSIGNEDTREAEVVWKKHVDKKFVKAGMEFR